MDKGDIATGLDKQGKRLTGNKFLQGLRTGIGKLKNSFTSLGSSLTGAMGTGKEAVKEVQVVSLLVQLVLFVQMVVLQEEKSTDLQQKVH